MAKRIKKLKIRGKKYDDLQEGPNRILHKKFIKIVEIDVVTNDNKKSNNRSKKSQQYFIFVTQGQEKAVLKAQIFREIIVKQFIQKERKITGDHKS